MDDKQIQKVFSMNLNNLRKKRQMSTNMLADLCSLSAGALKTYLYGKSFPSVKTICTICCKLNCSINELFGPIIDFPTEQDEIAKILSSFEMLPEAHRHRTYQIIAPFVERIVNGVPKLKGATFATRLKTYREDYGYSEEDITRTCGIAENTLKNYESSRLPGVPVFVSICRQLSASPELMLFAILDNDEYVFGFDKQFYALTPLQLSSLAITVGRLCNCRDQKASAD